MILRLRPAASAISLLVAALVAVTLFTHDAAAFGKRGNDVRQRISQSVKKALDAVKATPAQRNQVQAAIDQVIVSAEGAFGTQGLPEMDELLAIFARDRIDTPAVDALKQKRWKRQDLLADALVRAFNDVHDALSREQRQQLTDYARGRVEGKHMRRFKQTLMEGFVTAAVADMLEQLTATEPERVATFAARDQVIAALKSAQATQSASLDTLTAIFHGDTVDKAALARFRTEKEAQIKSVTDALELAISQVHGALSRDHRLKLVEIVRNRRAQRERNAAHASDGETGF